MRRWSALGVPLALLAAAGCGEDGGPGALELGWTLSDGRGCADSGVEYVLIAIAPAAVAVPLERRCADALGVARVRLAPLPPRLYSVLIQARSDQNTPLYSAEFPQRIAAGETARKVAELAFTGGL
jgi:hypothetical protein